MLAKNNAADNLYRVQIIIAHGVRPIVRLIDTLDILHRIAVRLGFLVAGILAAAASTIRPSAFSFVIDKKFMRA